MKNFAKLTLYFSLSFLAFFAIAILIIFVSSWIEMARSIPVEARIGGDVADAAWKALPAAIYLSILLSLNYSAQRKMHNLFAVLCIVLLGCVFSIAASIGINRTSALGPIFKPVSPVQAEPGLILSQSENVIVLLKESSDVRGPRLVSIPGRPFIYQELPLGPNNSIIRLPALRFSEDTPWFLKSIAIDFSISSMELQKRFNGSNGTNGLNIPKGNFLSLAAYCLSLVLLLASLRVIMELSKWPLANLFLGVLAFRGILTLETFLNSGEINALIGSFLNKRIPQEIITPVIFTALGILIIIYTLLTGLARPKRALDG